MSVDPADPSIDLAESAAGREARRHRRTVRLIRKVVLTALGVAILGAGIAMLFIPGPGGLAIVLGLFVLSLEYEWAERRLDQIRDKVVEAAHKAAASRLQTTVAVLSSIAMIVGGILWAVQEDWPLSSWYTGGTLAFGGVLALATIGWSILDLRKHRARDGGL